MIIRIFILFSISCIWSCKSNIYDCKLHLKDIVEQVEYDEFDSFKGLTIESSGLDSQGYPIIRGIYCRSLSGSILTIPYDKESRNVLYNKNELVFVEMAKLFEISQEKLLIKIDQAVKLFFKYRLYSIDSQRHIGDYVLLEVYPQCKVILTDKSDGLDAAFRDLYLGDPIFNERWYSVKESSF